jgi:hypothetical protein
MYIFEIDINLKKSSPMKLQNLILTTLLLLLSSTVFCQDFDVPKNYELKVAADYVRYEKDVIAATNWLIATPLNEQTGLRREVSAFLVQWINGSPTVAVEINSIIMDFDKKNKGMLVLFMGCCAKYVLENNYSKDMRAKHKAALKEMIAVYKAGKGITKDKKMEKLIASDNEGKLDEWLAENLKVGAH